MKPGSISPRISGSQLVTTDQAERDQPEDAKTAANQLNPTEKNQGISGPRRNSRDFLKFLGLYGEVTDPTEHDPKGEWRYLVNAIPNHLFRDSTRPASLQNEESKEIARIRGRVLENPAMMGEGFNPSTSLIDPRHTCTAWPNGYIVEAPQSLIAATHHVDIGIPALATPSEIEERKKEMGVSSAQDVLENTPSQRYNEVFICRNRGDGEATVVKATFAMVNKGDGSFIDEKTALFMQDIARKFNLPHVNIECCSRYTPDKVGRGEGGAKKDKIINVDIDDTRYFLGNFSYAKDQGGQVKYSTMTDQHFDCMLSFLEKNGVVESELNDIKEKYKEFKAT